MKLTEIRIENFRSIKSQNINVDHNCLVLLGKNEAGKSNILKAIAAVFGQYKVTDKDKRKKIDNETINSYYIMATIKLSEIDFNEILDRLAQQYSNIEYIVFNNRKTLFDFVKAIFHEIVIRIDIAENANNYLSYWSYKGADFELAYEVYLDGTTFDVEEEGKKQDITEIINLIFDAVKKLYKENPYQCNYWQYSSSHLLPSSINISDFILSPEKYTSLKNIFTLCNRHDIKREFEDAISQDGDYSNLLDQVSKSITKTFREIWKDFKETSIELMAGESEMIIKVTNRTKYSFEDRSDGFKKFISILLMLSTQARSNQIGERNIILIDEPDQSLYPSSAEYLRNELINISKTAKVIYATHSQYMIDSNCIERHLMVEKTDDITSINRQNINSPFSNDELLRRAIGSSIFEIIKTKNIIFEGWLDKELFYKYCEYHKKSKSFSQIGIVYLGGISGVETLIQLLILANKKFVIVSDSDMVSNKSKKDFEENYKEYDSMWLSYGDVIPDIFTMEDFISTELITTILKKINSDFIYDSSKKAIENIDIAVNNDKGKRQQVKKDLIDKIRKTDINENYSVFIEKLNHIIEEI